MATVREIVLSTGKTGYYCRYTDVDGQNKSRATKARSPAEAERWRVRCEERIRNGQPGDPREQAKAKAAVKRAAEAVERSRLTVKQLCDKFVAEYQGADLADVDFYRRQAKSVLGKHVTPEVGELDAAAVTRGDIVRLRDTLTAKGRSSRVVLRTLVQLGRVYQWALERELLAVNPVRGVRKPRAGGSTDFYSDDEIGRILAYAAEHDHELHALVAFAFYTGARKGEIAALNWGDVDFGGARILVSRSWRRASRKSGKALVLAMHPHLSAILTARRKVSFSAGDSLVFPTLTGVMRSKYELWGLDRAIVAINVEAERVKATQATVRRFRNPWHAFRHSHGTALAIGGAGLQAIQQALGQTTLSMAARYSHLGAEQVRQHVVALPVIGGLLALGNVVSIASAYKQSGKGLATAAVEADTESAGLK